VTITQLSFVFVRELPLCKRNCSFIGIT